MGRSCLYFEFFPRVLRLRPKQRAVVDKIREEILITGRWPEMVTFEEMNQEPPKGGEVMRMILSAAQAISRENDSYRNLSTTRTNVVARHSS